MKNDTIILMRRVKTSFLLKKCLPNQELYNLSELHYSLFDIILLNTLSVELYCFIHIKYFKSKEKLKCNSFYLKKKKLNM